MATEQTASECAVSKSADESHDAGDLPMKDPETSCESVDTEETPPSELCDDPFAIVEEENTEKLREISIEEKPEVVKSEQSPADAETEEKEPEQMDQDEDEQDDEEEEEEEEDEEENAAVLAEMEADWQRESTEDKEKNQGMTALLDLIRSKGSKHGPPSKKKKKGGAEDMAVPELKLTPFGMDGNLQLQMDGDRMTSVAEDKRKRKNLKKEKERSKKSELLSANQKGLKQKLKLQLHRKREQEIQQHRKDTEAQSAQSTHATANIKEADEEDADVCEEEEKEERECEKETESVPDSRASTVPLGDGDVCSDSESGSDPEDMARAALMAKPTTLSKEARALLDVEAEEEDEDGNGAEAARDEHEEEFGIAKDLLADKSENRRLRKLKKEYDDKRVDVHRQMCAKDDEAELQKLKSAFVDGEYAQMKQKGVCGAYVGAKDETAQATEFQFSARTSSALSTDPASFLSEDEEKNEFCVYGKDGQLNDVHTIRMKVMEWKRLREKDAMLTNDADEPEEREERALRRRRVQRKEFLVRSRTEHGEAELSGNGHAAKLLEKARNKKSKHSKKPAMSKAATTAFMGMDMSMGGVGGSSFMKHRNKCVEKAKIAQLRSKTGGGGGGGSKKAVVFERIKKRKRDEDQPADHGTFKKRRMQ